VIRLSTNSARSTAWQSHAGPSSTRPASTGFQRVEHAIRGLDHPEQGAFISITNALQFQLERGADPATLRHLIAAFIAFTCSLGIQPQRIKLRDNVDAVLQEIGPTR
jgi:hypothetical protein